MDARDALLLHLGRPNAISFLQHRILAENGSFHVVTICLTGAGRLPLQTKSHEKISG